MLILYTYLCEIFIVFKYNIKKKKLKGEGNHCTPGYKTLFEIIAP